MDKLKKNRKNLIITLSALLVLMMSIGIVYGKYTSSRVSIINLTVKHTVSLTLDANLPEDRTGSSVAISEEPVVLQEQEGKVRYPNLPKDKSVDPTNGIELDGYILAGWYLDASCSDGKEVKSGDEITVRDSDNKPATEVKLYAKWQKKDALVEIGGSIFYIDNDVDGAEYKFYDEDKTEITEWKKDKDEDTLAALKDAKYYLKVGSNDNISGDEEKDYKTDKFYVMGTEENGDPLTVTGSWSETNESTYVTDNEIGYGRTNTDALINRYKDSTATIWNKVNTFRLAEDGHDDWFIGTMAEQDLLRASGVAGTVYSISGIWSSVESSEDKGYMWDFSGAAWAGTLPKSNSVKAILLRSF